MNYAEQLKSPMWQKKRLEILERDKFTCQICLDTETQLHIHHQSYDKTYQTKAWEYPNHVYKTLCSDCHKAITDHLQEYGNDKEFNVLKVKNNGIKSLFIYTNGRLIISSSEGNTVRIGESTCIDAVQFLINNWLKNG